MKLNLIISGGQTGADQAGLAAGKLLGIPTGGTTPPYFITDEGRQAALLKGYGLVEGEYDYRIYPKRTRQNVVDSDGTVVFGNICSPGCKLTLRLCRELGKPYITCPTPRQLAEWLVAHNIKTLNVAGNRERTNPGIFNRTKDTLIAAIAMLRIDK